MLDNGDNSWLTYEQVTQKTVQKIGVTQEFITTMFVRELIERLFLSSNVYYKK